MIKLNEKLLLTSLSKTSTIHKLLSFQPFGFPFLFLPKKELRHAEGSEPGLVRGKMRVGRWYLRRLSEG